MAARRVSEANQFHPAHWRGAVAAVSELAEDRVPMFGEKITESRDFHAVDSGCSTVLLHSFIRFAALQFGCAILRVLRTVAVQAASRLSRARIFSSRSSHELSLIRFAHPSGCPSGSLSPLRSGSQPE